MPVTPTYPGVYVEEIPSGARTITGVATATTAFVGRAPRGRVNDPLAVQNFADYERAFGPLWEPSMLGYAVQQYFLNGGGEALVIRLEHDAVAATLTLPAGGDTLDLEASSPGAWGNALRVAVDHDIADPADTLSFNLYVREVRTVGPGNEQVVASEDIRNVSVAPDAPRFIEKVLEDAALARMRGDAPAVRPDESLVDADGLRVFTAGNDNGTDGDPLEIEDYRGSEADKTGIFALEKADLFNLMCIPPFGRGIDVQVDLWADALAYCKRRRAMLLIDAPSDWGSADEAGQKLEELAALGLLDKDAALYFPGLLIADPLKDNHLEVFAATPAIAGVLARTDVQRGVWKAPAGQDATILGARALTVKLTDGEQGRLNPLGVNCIRTLPLLGQVVWGARTLRGADRLASEWKYVPVRRLALYLEESLFRGLRWVVFEPNDEPLWGQIRLNVGAFMHTLFRQGAFQGSSPREAYFVKCDAETTTQNDRDRGIVNIVVGFAPLKPAEFVILQIEQIAGQVQV